MEYKKSVRLQLTDLTVQEASAIQAGLILLANSATYGQAGTSYPEYKKTAATLLRVIEQPQTDDKPV